MQLAHHLANIVAYKKQEVERLKEEVCTQPDHYLSQILNQNHLRREHFATALKGPGLSIIGEIKRQSPTRGKIGCIDNPADLALKYCCGGAAAISVLTDTRGFGGSFLDMQQVSQKLQSQYSHVSVLRKDFILDPLQLAEAIFFGANAVLLIVSVVGENLKFLIQEAHRLGLEVLTEIHDFSELELALEAEASIIGINHRNLKTFEIDLNLSESLKPFIPPQIITVAESGIHHPIQAKRMRELGFDAVLVGEALVRSKDPALLIKQMKGEENES
ncbi:indole-3-glycerol phosphate synthase [Chlamydia felis Fe/C-56]|uniref:indole-3-glycerol-phosphate synthase n=2 Tax=Chlamydia felis TaxID=83556 RepID=Q254S8_CHLFF|nr:indole-3-glycerol phosphate synthase [Chlamydia felis Fe/C-56]